MDRIINNIIAAAFCIFIATSAIFAVPPTNEVISMLKQKGEYENYVRLLKEAKERGYNANDISNNKTAATRTEKSSLRALAILVDFPNMPYIAGITSGLPQDFEDLLFSLETIPTGSLREYYLEVSYGNTDIYGDVAGWYTVSENYAYYAGYCNGTIGFGAYPYNAQRLVEDAIALADSDVDFSIYDNDGDGDVDILFVIHAGTGFEETGDNCEINSHQGRIFPRVLDGVMIEVYSMETEEAIIVNGLSPIGVYCHEAGHVLGLPDLYDYDESSFALGYYCLMSYGAWTNSARTPTHLNAWCKYILGWIDPVVVNEKLIDAEIPTSTFNPAAYICWTDGIIGNQYFIVENRQRAGFDSYLPGSGLMIWHHDMNAPSGNDNEWHALVEMEQADGDYDLQYARNLGDNGDPYPGLSNNREFGDNTAPSSNDNEGYSTNVRVWNISDSDSIMTASFTVTFLCGDTNNDEAVNIGDVVYLVNHIFNNGPVPLHTAAVDVNCDGNINVGDAVFLGNYVFQPGAPQPCELCQ